VKSLGALAYTREPGRMEADERVEAAAKELESLRRRLSVIERYVLKKKEPETKLIAAKKQIDYAETMLREAEKLRDERRAETNAQESQIDMGVAPGDGKAKRGIYRRKGNLLAICYDESDGGRPETFSVNKPSEGLIILQPGREVIVGTVPPSAIRKEDDLDQN
jgi:hypothetical protein